MRCSLTAAGTLSIQKQLDVDPAYFWSFSSRGLRPKLVAASDEQLKRDQVGLLRAEVRRTQSTFQNHAARAIFSINVTAGALDAEM